MSKEKAGGTLLSKTFKYAKKTKHQKVYTVYSGKKINA